MDFFYLLNTLIHMLPNKTEKRQKYLCFTANVSVCGLFLLEKKGMRCGLIEKERAQNWRGVFKLATEGDVQCIFHVALL